MSAREQVFRKADTSRLEHIVSSGARKSRRGSLDIYTAEYALKIGGAGEKKGITAMEQKTAFHMKVGKLVLYESRNIDFT